jgi:Zn-dependent protease with chaperone function
MALARRGSALLRADRSENRVMKAIQDYYYMKENQELAGPHSLAELKALAAEGAINGATHVARDGYEQWRPLSQELAGQGSLPETGSNPTNEPALAVEGTPPPAGPAAPITLDLPFDLRPEPATGTAAPAPQPQAGAVRDAASPTAPGQNPTSLVTGAAEAAAPCTPMTASGPGKIGAPPVTPKEKRGRVRVTLPIRPVPLSARPEGGTPAGAGESKLPPHPIEVASYRDLMPLAEMYFKGALAIWAALAAFVFLLLTARSFVGSTGALFCLVVVAGCYLFTVLMELNKPQEWITPDNQDPQKQQLWGAIQELAGKAKLPLPRIAIDRSTPEINAVTYGLSRGAASVLVTGAFLDHVQPTETELKAVLAHELSHVANGDCVISTLLKFPIWVMGKIRGLLGMAQQLGWGFLRGFLEAGAAGGLVGLVIVVMIVGLLIYLGLAAAFLTVAILLTMFFIYAFEREREYLADLYGSTLVGSPYPMQAALAKLELAQKRVEEELAARAKSLREGEALNVEVAPPAQPLEPREFMGRSLATPPTELHSGFSGEFFADHPVTQSRVYYLQHPDQRKRQLTRLLKQLEGFAGGGEAVMSPPTVRFSLLIGVLAGAGVGGVTLFHPWALKALALPLVAAGAFLLQHLAVRDNWSGATFARASLLASYAAATALLLCGILSNPWWVYFPLAFVLTFALFLLLGTKVRVFRPQPMAAAGAEPGV